MRLLIRFALLSASVLPGMAPAQIRGTVLNDLMNRSSVSALDAAAAIIIADAVGLDPMALIREVRPYGVTVYETAPAWYIVHECHRPFTTVYREHRKGKGWGVIAKEMGMHPSAFNKMRRNGDFDRSCWVEFTSPWHVDGPTWHTYASRGLSGRDIVVATALSGRDRDRFASVTASRVKTGYWDVPGHGKIRATDVGKSHKSVKSAGPKGGTPGASKSMKAGGASKSKGKGAHSGQGSGKAGATVGKGHGQAQGGAPSGKSKGKGGGQGNGKGKGGGNGKGHGGH